MNRRKGDQDDGSVERHGSKKVPYLQKGKSWEKRSGNGRISHEVGGVRKKKKKKKKKKH